MSTSIFNFNLQANVNTLRTGNSWSVTSNLSNNFNSYPEMNQFLDTNFLPSDAVKNISSNAIYVANTTGVYQFFYESNNVIGSVYPHSNLFAVSLPINNYKTLDISADGTKLFVMDSFGLVSSANLSSPWNVASAIGAVAGNTWMKSKRAGQTHSDYYMREDGNKLYIFNNNGTIEQYSVANADFRTAQIEHVSSSFGTGSGNGYFSDAGDRLFYLRGGLSTITWISQYNLSDNWNVNSAILSSEFAPIDSGGGLRDGSGIRLSNDGMNAYYFATSASNGTRYLHRMNMSNSWNIASRVGSYSDRTSSFSSFARVFDFKDDGTQIFVASGSTGLQSYNLATPWSITSITSNTTGNVLNRGPTGTGFSIFNNGSSLVIGSNTSNTINSMTMNPWSINTLAFATVDTDFFSVLPQFTPTNTLYFRVGADNSNVIMCDSRVYYNYRMSSNLDLSSMSFSSSKSLTGTLSTRADHFTINSDGDTIYQGRVASPITIGSVDKLTMSPSWNIASLSVSGDSVGVTGSSSSGIRVLISNPQNKFTIVDEDFRLVTYTQPSVNTLSTATFSSSGVGRYTRSDTEEAPNTGLKFTNDGLFFFLSEGNSIFVHRLSKAWDISTVTSVTQKSISTSTAIFNAFSISRTGRYVYLMETGRSYIDYIQLKRPFDYIGDSFLPVTINFGLYFNAPMYDADFSADGTRMVLGSSSGIQVFNSGGLGPWIPSGASVGSTIVSGIGREMPFAMSRNGKFLYTPYYTGNNSYIRRYTLSSPWGTSATLSQEILIPGSKNWSIYGLALDISGNIIYIFDARSKTVFSYNLGAL